MPRPARAAQLLLFSLAFTGLVLVLALSGGLPSYGLGRLMAPWLLVWLCALLALTYEGRARLGIRATTVGVLAFVLLGSVAQLGRAEVPAEFLDASLRLLLGGPAAVLLCLPEVSGWFRRP